MALSDLDRVRAKPFEPATVDRLARGISHLRAAVRDLSTTLRRWRTKPSIQFLDTADAINRMKDQLLRADTAGTMQALVGLWQIFCRQGSIAPEPGRRRAGRHSDAVRANPSRSRSVRCRQERRPSASEGYRLERSVRAAGSADRICWPGRPTPATPTADAQVVQDMNRILEAQRHRFAHHAVRAGRSSGEPRARRKARSPRWLTSWPRASPRSSFRGRRSPPWRRTRFAFGYWTEKHVELERKLNLRAAIDQAGERRGKAEGHSRACSRRSCATRWSPTITFTMLRPARRCCYTNPLFVRSHDFIGVAGRQSDLEGTELFGTGWPSNGGGRLVGSLARAALRAGRGRAELPDTRADAGADLGRSGAADDPERDDSALVERDAGSAALGGAAHALRDTLCWRKPPSIPSCGNRCSRCSAAQAPPARTVQVERLLEAGDVKCGF